MRLQLFSKIFIAFFIYLIITQLYTGAISQPSEGDSLAYHIPIARSIIDGKIIDPQKFEASPFLKYSPGSSEILLVPLILFGLPLNIYNVIAVAVLFLACIFVGKRVGLSQNLSIIFAVSICSLNTIVRWMNTEIIDIWLLVFFLLSLGLLEKPEKNSRYFLILGASIGMLVGSKFTGPVISFILFIFYIKNLTRYLNIKRTLFFFIPFTLLGISWYLRNFLLTGNPIYPQPFLFLKGGGSQFTILNISVLKVLSNYPKGFIMTLNAYIAEFTIWALAFFVCAYFEIKRVLNKRFKTPGKTLKVFLIGLSSLVLFLFLPSAFQEHITVSVFRYSYPAFILFILCTFLIAEKYKKEELLSIISISNIFILGFPYTYYPKLVFIYIPVILLVLYFEKINKYLGVKAYKKLKK